MNKQLADQQFTQLLPPCTEPLGSVSCLQEPANGTSRATSVLSLTPYSLWLVFFPLSMLRSHTPSGSFTCPDQLYM